MNVLWRKSGENYIITKARYDAPERDGAFLGHHLHNEYEIIFVLKGDITYVLEDKKYKLKPYDLVITRPSRYHYIKIDSNVEYERYNAIFPASFVGGELIERIGVGVETVSCASLPIIRDIFKKLDGYSELDDESFGELFSCLMKEMLYNIILTPEKNVFIPETSSPLISAALKYINENLYTIADIREISAALFVSENYFFRAFRAEMKISPKKYIMNKRLMAAKRRIDRGERPTDVYIKCGFSSYSAFFKRYVLHFGKTPSEK